jgi:hypothetical protein
MRGKVRSLVQVQHGHLQLFHERSLQFMHVLRSRGTHSAQDWWMRLQSRRLVGVLARGCCRFVCDTGMFRALLLKIRVLLS